MTTTAGKPVISASRLQDWRGSGYLYLLFAAEMADWVQTAHKELGGKLPERGGALPENRFFMRKLDIDASAATLQRAKVQLAKLGLLYRTDVPFSRYMVALQIPA
jgi:hypothetical protein